MNDQIAAALAVLPNYVSQHVLLSAAALFLGAAISLPLAVLGARNARLRWPLLAFASLVQTIPGLALVALFYPALLALSALTVTALGVKIPAFGFLPALLALTLYAMLPILRNAIAGLTGIDPAVREAADGVGMTPRQRLWRVEAPLAAPIIMAGVRTAAVWTIGAATLATPVGQTSLGNYIFSGLQTENWVFVLFGCFASAGLALAVDQILALMESGAARRDAKRLIAGAVLLAAGTLAALAPVAMSKSATYVIGAKNFGEQFILAELIGSQLERAGGRVERRDGLGSAVIFRALASGDLDVYVDYSGTIWTNVMRRTETPPREAMLAEIEKWLPANGGVVMLGALGFENAYALAMKRARAQALGVRTLDDLARVAPQLSLGADIEFLDRPEWAALRDAYGLRFREQRPFNPTFMYRALASGEADVISAFTSDGRILAEDLVTLADPRNATPAYDAILLISPRRANDAQFRAALQPLLGKIDIERMRAANLSVDRDTDKSSPAQAARELASAIGLSR